jgi:gas vesicle protein
MLRLFLGLADETAKFLSRLFGTSKTAKTEISQIKEELQSLIDKVGQSEQRAQEAFKPLEDLANKLDEISFRDDVSATGPITTKVAGQEPLEDLLSDLSDKTGVSPSLIRKILADDVNLGYEAGSPKRLDPFDDDSLKAYIQTQKLMNREGDLIDIIKENADMPRDKAKDYQDIFAIKDRPTYKDLGKTDIGLPKPKGILEEVEEALKANRQQQDDLKALEDKMADPKNIDKMTEPGGLGKLMKEVQDDKVVDLAEYRSRRAKDPVDDDFAMGGRVHAKLGMFAGIAEQAAKMFGDKGLMKVLFDKVAGMRRADRIADTEQAKNIMRDPETDLERLKPMIDDEGNVIQRGTPEGKMTVRDLEDLPRDLKYKNPELKQFEKFIEREKVRAILADQMGVDPKDVPEVNIDMALRDLKFFAMGGGVGSLFKQRTR